MFGGAGVYAEGVCFAIEQGGEVFLKVDALSQPSFAAAGSSPFIYVAKGKPMPTSFWRFRRAPATRRTNCADGPRSGSRRRGARLKRRRSRSQGRGKPAKGRL